MAKSNSFNKRELEKNKQKKREEKRKRREERKNNPTDTFEDMIAYVDEFGVISSTPPEPREKEDIEIEDIEISTPKMEEQEVETDMKGTVDFFNHGKGFGFIKRSGKNDSYFFHISNAPEDIEEGNQVTFELERGDRGLNAVNIKKI
ncbi:MAG: cold shock domain-containing protein [Proteiniphilum sp.]|nr:cold shock domain-containing protein [Proteiniphilum sp.]